MRREEARTAGVAARLSLAQAPPPVADYVYLFPHAIDRALGPIELVPRSHPWGTYDIAAHEPALCARPAGGLDCRGLGEVRGPSPRLQHPSPDHPGHSPLPLLTRSASPSTDPCRRARRGTPPPGCRFTRRRSRRARGGLWAHKSASPPSVAAALAVALAAARTAKTRTAKTRTAHLAPAGADSRGVPHAPRPRQHRARRDALRGAARRPPRVALSRLLPSPRAPSPRRALPPPPALTASRPPRVASRPRLPPSLRRCGSTSSPSVIPRPPPSPPTPPRTTGSPDVSKARPPCRRTPPHPPPWIT